MIKNRVVYNYFTGSPKSVVSNVLRSISVYTRKDRVRFFKIGITNDPERRFWEEHASYYDKMIVVYQSSSITNVSILEDELIEHNRALADNIIVGGGGDYGNPPYFLYAVIKHMKQKT